MTKTFFNPQETCWVGQKVRVGFSITEIQCFSRSFRKDRRKEDGAGVNFSQQTHHPSSLVPFCPPASFLGSAILAPPIPKSFNCHLVQNCISFSERQPFLNEGTQGSESCVSFPQMDKTMAPASPFLRPLSLPFQSQARLQYLRQGGESASAPGPRAVGDTTACFCPGGRQEGAAASSASETGRVLMAG